MERRITGGDSTRTKLSGIKCSRVGGHRVIPMLVVLWLDVLCLFLLVLSFQLVGGKEILSVNICVIKIMNIREALTLKQQLPRLITKLFL